MARPIGLLANPAAGKDIRRIVARASVFDNQEKAAIVRRAVAGAVAAGAGHFHYYADGHGIAQAGLDDFRDEVNVEPIEVPTRNGALATERAAMAMRDAGCVAVLVLGGDGTSRAFCRGWQDAPLLSISTGTNNVFPRFYEATVVGAVLGCLASGTVERDEVVRQAKCIELTLPDGRPDLALIDAVVSADRFVGSRALLDPSMLRRLLLTRADPAATGMTAIGGLLAPVSPDEDGGLDVTIGTGRGAKKVLAPIAPGLYYPIDVLRVRPWAAGEIVEIPGDHVLAFDGEREHWLATTESVTARLTRNGPHVINVDRAMQLAAERGAFVVRRQARKTRKTR